MWICCSSQKHPDIETKFCTDNNFFHVISVLPFNYSPCDAVLYACFKSGTAKREIMVGKYISSDSGYIADKKYSMSYLKSENIDCNDFSHFKINYGGDTVIELYPADYRYSDDMDDLSVVRAKNVLISLKNPLIQYDINSVVTNIESRLKNYRKAEFSFLTDYSWYIIENLDEDFGLSSVKHILSSDEIAKAGGKWYFGFLKEKRMCAVAAVGTGEGTNPFSNVYDCTVMYKSTDVNKVIFVAGILLLDDGQYFCRLS